jgi:hypothetical protein
MRFNMFPKKLVPEVGDVLPISGLRADHPPVTITGIVLSLRVGGIITNLPASQGGFVELEPERVHNLLGLPIWPLAEEVYADPGILRGARLNPNSHLWE